MDEEFERLFRQRYRALYRFVRQRVDDPELTEDLVAEAFARAWAKHQEGSAITMGWLVATAKNLIGNHYQRRRTERDRWSYLLAEELAEEARRGAASGAGSDSDDDAAEVREAMTRLRPTDALALQLTYWDGLAAREAAAVMECTTPAFWARLTRARRALRLILADAGERVGEQAGERNVERTAGRTVERTAQPAVVPHPAARGQEA